MTEPDTGLCDNLLLNPTQLLQSLWLRPPTFDRSEEHDSSKLEEQHQSKSDEVQWTESWEYSSSKSSI